MAAHLPHVHSREPRAEPAKRLAVVGNGSGTSAFVGTLARGEEAEVVDKFEGLFGMDVHGEPAAAKALLQQSLNSALVDFEFGWMTVLVVHAAIGMLGEAGFELSFQKVDAFVEVAPSRLRRRRAGAVRSLKEVRLELQEANLVGSTRACLHERLRNQAPLHARAKGEGRAQNAWGLREPSAGIRIAAKGHLDLAEDAQTCAATGRGAQSIMRVYLLGCGRCRHAFGVEGTEGTWHSEPLVQERVAQCFRASAPHVDVGIGHSMADIVNTLEQLGGLGWSDYGCGLCAKVCQVLVGSAPEAFFLDVQVIIPAIWQAYHDCLHADNDWLQPRDKIA
mmetsp:Transcript_30998/g.87012  ORF Transcript_30998/g.87012 Transcript_30998/m.87012 type:complete len:335 (+) Transcript_30998:1782-2786(+)